MRGFGKLYGRKCGAARSIMRRALCCLFALTAIQAVARAQAGDPVAPGHHRALGHAPTTVDRSDRRASSAVEQPGIGDIAFGQRAEPVEHAAVGSPAATDELSVETVVEQVLARNPSLAQMIAAWQAASARYPQVTSLEDPLFGATVGPASIGSRDVDFAYRLEASQKLPWPGKLGLRGSAALAEAAAASYEVGDVRLGLIESAKGAFYEYFLAYRLLAVNDEGLRLLDTFRRAVERRLEVGQVTLQDVLQADVEIGRQRERRLTLERMRKVGAARINTLMHVPPDNPLGLPPSEVKNGGPLPEAEALRASAVARRPDLRALESRIAAEQASLALACKEYYPDFDVVAAYDAFWQPPEEELRPSLGVRLNLPIRRTRRRAAVQEAQARIAQRRAELARRIDVVNFEVEQAYEQVVESEKGVRLYEEAILPAARKNVTSALAAYTTGQIPFLSLIEAQRSLVGLSEGYYSAVADLFRRRATLERVVGEPATVSP